MILGVFLLHLSLLFGTVWSCPAPEYIAPLCTCKLIGADSMMFCNNVMNAEELIPPLMAAAPYDMFSLAITDSSILYLPSGVFKDAKFKKVMFSNSQIMALSDSDLAFEGLEDHLQEIRATDAHYITQWDWSQLRELRRIDLIDVHMISMYSLDEEFPRLDSLTMLGISKGEISFLHPTAFRHLSSLKILVLKDNELTEMTRVMLPSPALRLTKLDLSRNQLSSLPSDFFTDMPSLQEVELSYNKFVTLDEDTFTWALDNLLTLNFVGNDFRCDCRLRWLVNLRKPFYFGGKCSQPDSLKGDNLEHLTIGGLWC